MPDTDRFDLVLFGASGFTGRLVGEYLAKAGSGIRWAIAGRDRGKLEATASDLGFGGVPVMVADAGDPQSLAKMAASTKVVCTTVGPYSKYGTPLVEACVEAGIGYCDLTGEVHWIREMINRFSSKAETTGARIVFCCGFDSIPSDLGTFMLAEYLFRVCGRRLARVRCRVAAMKGGVSGGTIASMFARAEAMRDPEVLKAMGDPYALLPIGSPRGADRNDHQSPQKDLDRGRWTAPFVMAGVNTRVVRRSQALLGEPYAPSFSYEEAVDTGAGPIGFSRAALISLGLWALAGSSAAPGLSNILKKVLPKPGEGPSKAQREGGHFRLELFGESDGASPVKVQGTVAGARDPGYGETAKMLGEAAMCLALDPLPTQTPVLFRSSSHHGADAPRPSAPHVKGMLTPASAMGMLLIERLRRAGMTFEVR